MSALPASSPFIPNQGQQSVQSAVTPAIQIANQNSGLELLMQIEADARDCTTLDELNHLIASRTKKLISARQIFVFDFTSGAKVCAISSLPKVDRSVPLVQELEQTIGFLNGSNGLLRMQDFNISPANSGISNALESYPFRNLLWVPMLDRSGSLSGGLLLASENRWEPDRMAPLTRLAATFAHAKALLLTEQHPKNKVQKSKFINRWTIAAAACCLFAISWYPVAMTTLAPFEVTSRKPFVIAASIDGVLEDIMVQSGQTVAEGDVLLRFQNTVLANKKSVAEKEVQLAQAQVKRANQLAFDSQEGRQELGIAKAQLFVKQAQLKLAEEQAAYTQVTAPQAGVAVLADKQSLIGKPFKIGQKIMEIADPKDLRVSIRLPVKDSIALEEGARVKLFLDSDPLNARHATIELIDYQATQSEGSALAYQIIATFVDQSDFLPRLGVMGTAHLEGREVPLLLYVLRRPITAARQWLGI